MVLRLPMLLFLLSMVHAMLGQNATSVFFELDEATLTDSAETLLKDFVIEHAKVPGDYIIEGFSDTTGNTQYNLQLSEQRALQVEYFLNALGISDAHITGEFYGETRISDTYPRSYSKRDNRRVDIIFIPSPTYSDDDMLIKGLPSKSIERIMAPRTQTIYFNNRSRRKIVGMDDTFIIIDRKALSTLDGKTYTGQVELELREYYTAPQLLSIGINTQRTDHVMETGGVLYINMRTESDEPLLIKPLRSITIGFQTDTLKGDMELYAAETEKDGSFDWTPSSRRSVKDHTIELAQGQLVRASRRWRKVQSSMGILDARTNHPRPIAIHTAKTDAFGYFSCLRDVTISDTTVSLNVKVENDTSRHLQAIIILHDNETFIKGAYNPELQSFTFNGLPLGIEADLIISDLFGATAYGYRERLTINAQMPIHKVNLSPITSAKAQWFRSGVRFDTK